MKRIYKCLHCNKNIENENELYDFLGDLTGDTTYHKKCYYEMVEEDLSKLNIQLYDNKGNFRSFKDIMKDLSDSWYKLINQ